LLLFNYVLLFKGAKVHFIDIPFPIQSEDDVVNMYEEYLRQHPEIKMAVIGKHCEYILWKWWLQI